MRKSPLDEKSVEQPQSSDEELFKFRVEQDVKERITKWATRQFALVTALLNIIAFLGLGAFSYNFIKSSLDAAITRQVEAAVSTKSGSINDALNYYQDMVKDAVKDVRLAQMEADRTRLKLNEAIDNANKAAEGSRLYSTSLKDEYSKFRETIKSEQQLLKNASTDVVVKYKELDNNYKKWGSDIYSRASIAVDILGINLADLTAIKQYLMKTSQKYSDLEDLIASEKARISENSESLVISYIQTGIDRSLINESKMELDLQLRGFKVVTLYSGDNSYQRSKENLQGIVMNAAADIYIKDMCVIVRKTSGQSNERIFERIVAEFERIGNPVACKANIKFDFSPEFKDILGAETMNNAKNIILVYATHQD